MSDRMATKMVELTDDRLREILALAGKVTPVEPQDLMAYEHGGGRLAVIRGRSRTLVADFYGEGDDRDFYAAANPATVAALASELLALRSALALIREEAGKDNAPYGRSDGVALNRIRIMVADEYRRIWSLPTPEPFAGIRAGAGMEIAAAIRALSHTEQGETR